MASAWGMFQEGVNQNIAFWAHVGGFVAGLAMMPLLSFGSSPADKDWRTEMEELFEWEDPHEKR
jgi:membrane associated rhomboid family serine protease